MIHELIKKQTEEIEAEKFRIVKERIKEKVGIDIDIQEEAVRIFPRIALRSENAFGFGFKQRYYWNDGTINGLLLVEFYYSEPENIYDTNSVSLQVNLKYR